MGSWRVHDEPDTNKPAPMIGKQALSLPNQAKKKNVQSRLAFAKPLSLEVSTSAQVLSQKARCQNASEKWV